MEEKNKRINPIVIIILIFGIYMTISVISKKIGIKEKADVEKILYIPVDITKKYPKDFAEEKVAIKEIKNSIKDKKSQIIDNKEVETYYDSKGRIVYTIKAELEAIVSSQGGKGGYYYKRFYPEENGVIYDKSGHVIKKLETSSSYNTGFYEVASKEDLLRKSYLNNGTTNGVIKIVNISYNEKGEKLREESVDLSRNYTKVIIEYESEKKIIDDETDYEPLNKIYVEITKEYDENEKLIKKFVLRKNKFNEVRSETNFDFIKGEIVTKYYDGEKAFATVTETLIEKDRAIVKRERVGDDFVIWDLVEYRDFAYLNRFIVNKNTNIIKYEFKNTKYSYDWHYNDDEKGLNVYGKLKVPKVASKNTQYCR